MNPPDDATIAFDAMIDAIIRTPSLFDDFAYDHPEMIDAMLDALPDRIIDEIDPLGA